MTAFPLQTLHPLPLLYHTPQPQQPLPLYRPPLLLLLLLLLLQSTTFAPCAARPLRLLPIRDVASTGPQGELGLVTRWRDTVGTAMQVDAHGPAKKNAVFHALRTGPLSDVYRATLSAAVSAPCEPRVDTKCEVAIDGFGTVGEVQYTFDAAQANVRGRSTQTMVACRCLSDGCVDAVLVRPVNILTLDQATGQLIDTTTRTCLYEAVGNQLSDCHTELLRVSYREHGQRPAYLHNDTHDHGIGSGAFTYSVRDPLFDERWDAVGQRGWTRDCSDSEIASLPTLNFTAVPSTDIGFNEHITDPTSQHCVPPPGVRYLREVNDTDGEECAALYDFAAVGAAHRATQQDEIAIAHLESSYIFPKPELVSDTELALSASAAALGLLFVWSTFRKQRKKKHSTIVYTVWVLVVQVLSYALEALPLHTALGNEVSARAWSSTFAFVDGTVALAADRDGSQGSARRSVMILTGVVGEVQYLKTRVTLVAGLTAFFDVAALLTIGLTTASKMGLGLGSWRVGRSGTAEKSMDSSIGDVVACTEAGPSGFPYFMGGQQRWWRRQRGLPGNGEAEGGSWVGAVGAGLGRLRWGAWSGAEVKRGKSGSESEVTADADRVEAGETAIGLETEQDESDDETLDMNTFSIT